MPINIPGPQNSNVSLGLYFMFFSPDCTIKP